MWTSDLGQAARLTGTSTAKFRYDAERNLHARASFSWRHTSTELGEEVPACS
jgi:hypothetical protein